MWLFQSKYKEEGKKEAAVSLYSILPETPETQHAREASELQSEVVQLQYGQIFSTRATSLQRSHRNYDWNSEDKTDVLKRGFFKFPIKKCFTDEARL